MRLTFISNACCIYESQGFRLLCDPWLTEGAFASWVHDPPLKTKPEDLVDVDSIYISHIHPDHLCEETLSHFSLDTPIVTLRDKLGLAEKKLKSLGFTWVRGVGDKCDVSLDCWPAWRSPLANSCGMQGTMFGPFTKHPFHDCEIGNVVDSALMVTADGKRILNTNDNTFSQESATWFRETYGQVDVAQLNWNNAGPYPACFENLTHAEKLAEAKRCVDRNLAHMLAVARILGAKHTMPFAGAYKLGFGLEHLNQYLGICTAKEACSYLGANDVRPLYLEEGESVDL